MDGEGDGSWVLVAPRRARQALEPLVERHAARRRVVVHERDDVPTAEEWPSLVPSGARGLLLVGDRRRSPTTALPGLVVPDATGRPVPAGWVPAGRDLSRFVAAANHVHTRTAPSPVAVLGQRTARYQRLCGRLVHHLGDTDSVRWGGERVTREDLVAGLSSGLGMAVYLGHGRPSGWAAYRGLRAHHLAPVAEEPVGCLMSVTCWTASRWQVGTSFAERVVLAGVAASSLGAVRPVLHLDSTRVVVALAHALREGPPDVAGLLRRVFAGGGTVGAADAAAYRLCGDPLALLAGADHASERAHAVFAPEPDFRPAPAVVAS